MTNSRNDIWNASQLDANSSYTLKGINIIVTLLLLWYEFLLTSGNKLQVTNNVLGQHVPPK